jgi:hypothetical protein
MIKGPLFTLASAVLLALLPQPVHAQPPESGFEFMYGCKTLELGEHWFQHDTHPDDSFLPDSNVPGSAGVTNAGGTHVFATIGGRYRARLSDLFSLTLNMELLMGDNRDRHQNDNDSRPAEFGAFVYSKTNFGLCASAGLSCHIEKFHGGVEAQLAAVLVESGWDRFNADESQHSQFACLISAGPRIGWSFDEHVLVEGTVQFGRGVAFGVKIIFMF